MIDLNKIDFEEISVNDQYIDDMMEHFGFTWDEPNMEYVKGNETVSGDFASNMAKLKKYYEEKWVAHQRQSEWDRTCSILRGMGVKFDGKEAWRIRKQWMESEAAEKKRKEETNR